MVDIRVTGLVKSFDLEKRILDGLSFQVDRELRYCLESCFLRSRTFSFLMSLLTILIRSISSGLRDIFRIMRTHLY